MVSARIAVLVFSASALRVSAQQAPVSLCETALCRFAASGNLSILRWPDFSDYRARIQRFYQPTGYAFAWIYDGAATEQARDIIQILIEADAKGLDPEDYDASRWAARLEHLNDKRPVPTESDFAEVDLALTVSVMRYASDLHFGRVNPGLFHSSLDIDKMGLSNFIEERLTGAVDVRRILAAVEPPYDAYWRTQQVLQQYVAMSRNDDSGPLPVPKKPIEPGSPYIAIAQLANLLRRLGDLPPASEIYDSGLYEAPLMEAVKRFQARHGLEADGRLGKATFAQLNTPLSHRIRQLQLTLERWRWVPHRFPRPPIVVNIPEFELRALNRAYQTELEMKVVVGKAYHHQTPMLAADMKTVIFRPFWNVPRSIQRDELVPKIEKDWAYLSKNGYEVVTPKDTIVTSGSADESTLAQLRSGKLRIRQTPGSENALGLVKFLFPNEHDVYMHDTPVQVLFSKSRRDFSHGCIRLEKPRQLAEWVLREQDTWTPERIASAMNGTKTISVALDKPIPVLIVYATAVVLANGDVRFFEDIYGEDARVEKLLAKGYPRPPVGATSGVRGPRPRE